MEKTKFVVLIAIIAAAINMGCVSQPLKETTVISTPIAVSTADVIIEGQGWKSVVLGASKDSIDTALGRPDEIEQIGDVYFGNYKSQGIQINYDKSINIVKAIFFYHGDEGYSDYVYFNKKTDKNIGFGNTADDVLNTYGEPVNDFKKENWRRIEYKGIDFRFVDGEMVRISVFQATTTTPTTVTITVPTGATAKCVDGTYSFSKSRQGTCSRHGGVAIWY